MSNNPITPTWRTGTRTGVRTAIRMGTGPLPLSTLVDSYPSVVTAIVPNITTPITQTTTIGPPTTILPSTTTTVSSTTTTEFPTTTTTTTSTTTTTTTLSTSPITSTRTGTRTSTSTSTTSSLLPPTTTSPTISPTETPSHDNENNLSTGAIVGIVVGALAVIVALTALAMFASRRRRRQRIPNNFQMFNPMGPSMQESRGGDAGGCGPLQAVGSGSLIPEAQAPSMGSASLLGESQFSQRPSSGTGYESDILVGGGEAAAAGGAYGYEANRLRQMQQQQMYQEAGGRDYYQNQQSVSYTPPTEPGMSDEERYNPAYAAQREQEAARYNQYQQYRADQEWRQAAAMAAGGVAGGIVGGAAGGAAGGYYGGIPQPQQAEYGAQGGGYYLDQQRYSDDQSQHLQQLRHGFEPGTEPGGISSPSRPSRGSPHTAAAYPPNNDSQFDYVYGGQQLPGTGYVAPYPSATGASSLGDYATPESDARFTKSEPWPEVPPSSSSSVGERVPVVTLAPAAISVSATESTGVSNSKRNSQLSVASLSTSTSGLPGRVHSPQMIPPPPKRAPQVLYPDSEPSFSSS